MKTTLSLIALLALPASAQVKPVVLNIAPLGGVPMQAIKPGVRTVSPIAADQVPVLAAVLRQGSPDQSWTGLTDGQRVALVPSEFHDYSGGVVALTSKDGSQPPQTMWLSGSQGWEIQQLIKGGDHAGAYQKLVERFDGGSSKARPVPIADVPSTRFDRPDLVDAAAKNIAAIGKGAFFAKGTFAPAGGGKPYSLQAETFGASDHGDRTVLYYQYNDGSDGWSDVFFTLIHGAAPSLFVNGRMDGGAPNAAGLERLARHQRGLAKTAEILEVGASRVSLRVNGDTITIEKRADGKVILTEVSQYGTLRLESSDDSHRKR